MPKDANGVVLAVGDRVVDDIFGEGTVLGTCNLKKGAGLNVRVRWDNMGEGEEHEGGRSSEHLTKLSLARKVSTPTTRKKRLISASSAEPSPSPTPRQSPRLKQLAKDRVDSVEARGNPTTSAVLIGNRIHGQEANFMVNFFGRAAHTTAVPKPNVNLPTGHQKKSAASTSTAPLLAGFERVRAPKMKTKSGKRPVSTADLEDSEGDERKDDEREGEPPQKKAKHERGPNKAGRISKQTTVSLMQRLKEFPGQGLKVSAGVRARVGCVHDC